MKTFPVILILIWIVIIAIPEIISYILWWLFIFIWLNMLFIFKGFKSKWNKEEYVKFWKYKIYR